MTTTRKIRPAIYSGPLGWGWCRLGEVAEMVGQLPAEVWRNFFFLGKDVKNGILAWSKDLETLIQDGTGPEPQEFRSVFVPAGWALDVIDIRKRGFWRVVPIEHRHYAGDDGCPVGTLRCYADGTGYYTAVVGLLAA